MADHMTTMTFGGPGGKPFGAQSPRAIGIRGGQYVDALVLNGSRHGGLGGAHPEVKELNDDDYWNAFSVMAGKYVDQLRFNASNGATVYGGEGRTTKRTEKSGIRIVSIAGRSDKYLDAISIQFVENYKPSKVAVENHMAIFSAVNGPIEIKEAVGIEATKLELYEKATTHMTALNVSASVEAEYYAKVSSSLSLTIEDSSVTTINRQVTEALTKQTETTIKLDADHARFLVCPIRVMKDDSNVWYFPIGTPEWSTHPNTEYDRLKGYFDLSGAASTITGLPRTTDTVTNLIKLGL
jgi:hypothetical protein